MRALKCFCCPRSMANGFSLFRVNAKGQPGIWACEQHIKNTDSKPADEVRQVVEILEQRN